MIERLTNDELLHATGHDPMVRAALLGGRIVGPVWSSQDAWAWQTRHRGEPSVMGIGSPAGAATIFTVVEAEVPGLRHVSLPRGWLERVASDRHVEFKSDWDWFWTEKAPAVRPHEDRAAWLSPEDGEEVAALLREAMPDAAAWPGDARVRRWAGIRDAGGRLVSCTADTGTTPLIGHVSSVATAPDQRRKGYGAALMAWVMRQYFEEGAELVTLGMYADNTAGRLFYEQLGFHCEHEFTSATVA